MFRREEKIKQKDEFDSKLLDLSRVERMTGGGRRLKFRAVMIVGDRKGRVGLGVGKGVDVAQSIEKSTKFAKKNLVEVPIVNGTVPFDVEAKFGAARILIRPQIKGRGLVAGGVVRTICELAGIQDVSSKVLSKSRNKINNAKATLKAFDNLKKTFDNFKNKESKK
ncbi:MAG: 30S ribosomal protein S5 [Candidatus Nealsonbacteria bacterium]|nr:30S ribosomal protein S5 [Candidatus Nealsonbacteria bacterium]